MSTTTEKLTPQADEQRARLEEKLLTAQFDEDENGNRKYKNLGAHVLPLLQILGLHVSGVYSFRDIFDNLFLGLVIHNMAVFGPNNHQQRDGACVPDTNTCCIRNTTNRTRRSTGSWIQNIHK